MGANWVSIPVGVATLEDKFAEILDPSRRFGLMTWYFEELIAGFAKDAALDQIREQYLERNASEAGYVHGGHSGGRYSGAILRGRVKDEGGVQLSPKGRKRRTPTPAEQPEEEVEAGPAAKVAAAGATGAAQTGPRGSKGLPKEQRLASAAAASAQAVPGDAAVNPEEEIQVVVTSCNIIINNNNNNNNIYNKNKNSGTCY